MVLCVLFLSLSIIFVNLPRQTFYNVDVKNMSFGTIDIFGNNVVRQKFNTGMLSLNNVYINLVNRENYYSGTASVTLFHGKEIIYDDKYNYNQLKNGVIRINLDSYDVGLNDDFSILIKCEDCTEDVPLVLSTTDVIDSAYALDINGVNQESALTMSFYGKHNNYSYAIVCGFTYVFLLFILLFNYVDKKRRGKIYLYYILEFIFSILTMFLFIDNFCHYMYMSRVIFLNYILFIGCLSVLIYLFVSLIKNKYLNKERLYLALAIPLSLGYTIFMIPNHVADESAHFARAYDLVNSNIFSTKENVNVPNDFLNYNMYNVKNYDDLYNALFKVTKYKEEAIFNNVPYNYNFVLYFFSGIGILIGKVLSLPMLITYYLSRIFNVCFMLLCGYFTIKFIPFGKNVTLVYLLNPMYLHQAASVGADSVVNSVCLLFIAIVLYFREIKDFKRYDFLLLILLILLLGFAKYVYIPLLLLLLLLIKNKGLFNKKHKTYIIGSILLSIILCAFFVFLFFTTSPEKEAIEVTSSVGNISVLGQFRYIIFNPIYDIKCLVYTIYLNMHFYVETFLGMELGWLNICINPIAIYIYAILLLFSPFIYLKDEKGFFDKKEKFFCNILCIILIVFSMLSMWLYCTSVGAMLIQGVQGRYFLPFMLLGLLTLSNKKQKITINNYDYKFVIVMLFIHMLVFVNIIYYFI